MKQHPYMLRYKAGRLMFNITPDPDAGGGPPVPPTQEELGFPANTPVAEMTDPQQAAYWRAESKKQQKIAESRKDYDEIKAKRDQLVATHSTDQDRAIAEAKTAGAAEATSKLLMTAVRGELRAATQRTVADIDSALEFVDITKFTDANGDLDADKLATFATTLGTGAPDGDTPPGDPARDALERQKQQRGSQHGGSISAQEELEYQRLTGKN